MTQDSYIGVDLHGSVAVITLNNPDKFNSFNRKMSFELLDALDRCAKEDAIRSVLITGSGRAFCAGQDLAEVMPAEKPEDTELGETVREQYNPMIRKIRNLEKPVIAAVNGVAAGAGANLALACDIVVAAKSASFVQAFTKLGLVPDSGGTYLLPRIVGLPIATAMIMLNDKITSEQAKQYGMIYKVSENETCLDDALKIATYLASQPTKGLGLAKRALNIGFGNDLESQLELEEKLQNEAGKTEDYSEGVKAFIEKRKPDFKGK